MRVAVIDVSVFVKLMNFIRYCRFSMVSSLLLVAIAAKRKTIVAKIETCFALLKCRATLS